jgi:predicted protein tyrosine phosphatase
MEKFDSSKIDFEIESYSRVERKDIIVELKKLARAFENSLGPEHLLFVGNTGITRSAAAEKLFLGSEDYEARSAGLFPTFSEKKLNTEKFRFAGKIIVMNEEKEKQKTQLLEMFPETEKKEIIVLNIEDKYKRYDEELVKVLKEKLCEKGIVF